MKTLSALIISAIVLSMSALPAFSDETALTHEACMKPLVSAFAALSDEHIKSVQRGLHMLADTNEAKSGDWERMKGPLADFSGSGITVAAVWFANPDGSYFTVAEGLTGLNISDRAYFTGLMEGKDAVGSLVISKSTGKRSTVVAVPVIKDGGVVGALGASMSVEEMSRMLGDDMGLPDNMVFYALDKDGQSSLHKNADLLFAYPSDMGSESLDEALKQMMSEPEGVVRYEFRGKKTVFFKRSTYTDWVYAVGVVGK
ncbi:MAG: cache domain-containing protein [Nitrospirae bacterium]|nr:cache domain-containing protein [Nitrospirota bacterium]MBI5696477.1 cache domain-containing protein [Nitrospirota bacterium]